MIPFTDEEVLLISENLYYVIEPNIKDRTYHLKKYQKCFLGTDAVKILKKLHFSIRSDQDAVELGQRMVELQVFYHVARDKPFLNKDYFYRFSRDDDLGKKDDGARRSWSSINNTIPKFGESQDDAQNTDFQPGLRAQSDGRVNISTWKLTASDELEVNPLDEHNSKLLDNVHPMDWVNPEENDGYTLLVIGAGTAGIVTATGAANVEAKVGIIEEHLMGGDTLNVGCVPSKALINAAKNVKIATGKNTLGIIHSSEQPPKVDFGAIMERMREIRASISCKTSYNRISKDVGVAVYKGKARFVASNKVEVAGKTLTFKKAVIATGASPAMPSISGLISVPFLTNISIFNLTELPPTICVVGAGPLGLELAQTFARFGSKVTVFVRGEKILPKEDRDAAKIIYDALVEDGVNIMFNTRVSSVSVLQEGEKYKAPWNITELSVMKEKTAYDLKCEALLIATGRAPNVENMGLDKAGVEFDTKRGVHINKHLQTTNKNVYAVGDVCSQFQFTHVADFMARTVVRNALLFGSGKHSSLLIPWATYTEPEVAHVGLYEQDMEKRNISFDTYMKKFSDIDRAICDGDTKGFVKIHCKKGSDEILGATIVNPNAGNLISEVTLAMQTRVGIGSLAHIIHPYPTQAEAIRLCGDLYNKNRMTGTTKGILSRIANRSLK